MPQNARSSLVSPNVGAAHRVPALAFSDPEERKLSQGEIAAKAREILTREFPGVEVAAVPRRPRRERLRERLHRAARRRGPRRQPRRSSTSEAKAVADVARTDPGHPRRPRVAPDRLPRDPRRHRPREGRLRRRRRRARRRRRRSTRRSATSTRPSVWIDPHNGQSYYVVTFYDGTRVADTAGARRAARARQRRRAGRCSSAPTATSTAASAPIAIERNHLERVAHVLMQTEGRDIGTRRRRARSGARDATRARATSTSASSGRSS